MKDQKSLNIYRKSRLKEFSYGGFYCSLTHGSGFCWYEFPCNGFPLVSLPCALPVVRYHVDVHTGQLKQADTESEVSLCLYGERGDSGLRLLYKSNMTVKFQRGQVSLHKQFFMSLAISLKVVVYDWNWKVFETLQVFILGHF